MKRVIDQFIREKKVLVLKYWGGKEKGSLRKVLPWGWKSGVSQFYGKCMKDLHVKNYVLSLIQWISADNGEELFYNDCCKINFADVHDEIPQPFELPAFNNNNNNNSNNNTSWNVNENMNIQAISNNNSINDHANENTAVSKSKFISTKLPSHAKSIEIRKQIAVIATKFKSSANQSGDLLAYCQKAAEKSVCKINSSILFLCEAFVVYQYVIASLLSRSSGCYLQFDGSGLVKGRGFLVVRIGGVGEGREWNEIVRYLEVFEGGADHVTEKVIEIIKALNKLQEEMGLKKTKLYEFRGAKFDNCNENTGIHNGVKKQLKERRKQEYDNDAHLLPKDYVLTEFVCKVCIVPNRLLPS
jgi:hypothetical protein